MLSSAVSPGRRRCHSVATVLAAFVSAPAPKDPLSVLEVGDRPRRLLSAIERMRTEDHELRERLSR